MAADIATDQQMQGITSHRVSAMADYHGYDVERLWSRDDGLTVRRLVRTGGVVAIPEVLPGYRVTLSLRENDATLRIGRRTTTDGLFAAGTTVLGQPEDVFRGEMRGHVDVLLFLMQSASAAARLDDLGYRSPVTELRDLPARADPGLLDASRRLVAVLDSGLAGSELHCETLIEAMVTRILLRHGAAAERAAYRETLSPIKLRRLMEFIEENLAAPLRLADLARAAATSRAHLARAFRNETGLPLHRYLLGRRLEHARMLLLRTDRPVGEIARLCGFVDAAHFSRAYKIAFGHPPSRAAVSSLGWCRSLEQVVCPRVLK